MSYRYNPSIVTDGLVFYVDAGNTKSYPGSGGTWSDLVGDNDASFNNMDDINNPSNNYDSGNGGSILLDGTNDYVSADIAATTDSSFTYNFWINTKNISGAGSNNQNIILFNRGNGGKGTFLTHFASEWRFTIGGVSAYTIADTISTNTIYNACWVVDGTTWTMYVDGALVGSTTISASRTDSLTNTAYLGVVINSNGTIRGDNSDHSMYSVGYYDRALTAAEVTQNYNALKNRFI